MPATARGEGLSTKICDLKLSVAGSRLESLVERLYSELEDSNISYRPPTYLSDEWGCPHRVPIIGIPFYLAQKRLALLETRLSGIPAETESEVMHFLRHEAGHAFNYAYRLYRSRTWQKTFGDFSQPYREIYRARPFSARFVRHVPGWYAQKHPDEDFAETFAVWLTPESNWQKGYAGTRALKKLLYVDRTIPTFKGKDPEVSAKSPDRPVEELTMTLASWFASRKAAHSNLRLPPIIDLDLRRLFPGGQGRAATPVLQAQKAWLIRLVNNWTGLDRHLLAALLEAALERVRYLRLKIAAEQSETALADFASFLTALAMNSQDTGSFVEE